MADEIKGLITDLKFLVDSLDEIKKITGGEKLVLDFLSMGTGSKVAASALRTTYEEASTQTPEIQARMLAQANEDLRDHKELLQEIIKLQERLNDSRTASATETTEAKRSPNVWELSEEEAKKQIQFFKTSQGSLYAFNTVTGQSNRIKSLHDNTGVEDVGLSNNARRTYFVDQTRDDVKLLQSINMTGLASNVATSFQKFFDDAKTLILTRVVALPAFLAEELESRMTGESIASVRERVARQIEDATKPLLAEQKRKALDPAYKPENDTNLNNRITLASQTAPYMPAVRMLTGTEPRSDLFNKVYAQLVQEFERMTIEQMKRTPWLQVRQAKAETMRPAMGLATYEMIGAEGSHNFHGGNAVTEFVDPSEGYKTFQQEIDRLNKLYEEIGQDYLAFRRSVGYSAHVPQSLHDKLAVVQSPMRSKLDKRYFFDHYLPMLDRQLGIEGTTARPTPPPTPKAVVIDASGAEIPITPVATSSATAASAVEPELAKPVIFTPARPVVPVSRSKAAAPSSRPPAEPPKPPSKPPAPPPENYGGDDDFEYRLIERGLPKRRDIGNRPKGVNTVDEIIEYVINNRGRFDTAGDIYTPVTAQVIQNLLKAIDSGDASKENQLGIVRNFRKLFPMASTRQMQGTARGNILSTVSSVIQHLGLTGTPAAQNLHTTSDQYVLDLLNDLVEKVAIVDREAGQIQAVSIDKDLIRSKINAVVRGISNIVRRAVTNPTVTAAEASGLVIEDFTDNFYKIYGDASVSTDDDETTNALGINVFRPVGNIGGGPTFVNRRGLGGSRGRQSFRQALRGAAASDRARVEGQDYSYGSQVVGYQSDVIFPDLGVDKSIEAQIKAQREQVNQEIAAGKMVEVTVGNRRVRMPESLARSRVAAARAASAMSQDTSLVGRRGSDEGPIGVYGSNSLYQSTLDLHKAALIQQYLTNPDTQIASTVDERFIEQVISQEDIEGQQNTARLYGQRAIEQLQYRERQALLRHVTGSTVEERRQGYDEAFAAAQQREFLQKLMHETTTPQERGELLGIQRRDNKGKSIAGQFADISADEALSYIFGERLTAVPDFRDASVNIIKYAGRLNEQLAEQGIAAPSRNYTTSSVMKRILSLFQTGVTDDDRRRLIDGKQSYEAQMNLVGTPHTRVYNGQARDMSRTGMVEKELFDVISDFFGLSGQDDRSMFSSIYHAGKIATEEGALQPADVIAQAYGGDVRMPLSAVFSGAEDFRNLANMGMPIVDYARLASKTDRTRQEEEALALAQERMPLLATLGRGELSRLAEVDLQQDPKQVIRTIVSIIGKRIQAEIEKVIRKRAAEAGKNEAETKLLFDENERTGRVEEGFQPFFRAFNFFNLDSFDSNPEINRALRLISSVAEEQDKGQTELDFMSKATGVAVPTIAPSAPVPSTRYPVAELGREMAVAEAGRAGGTSVTGVRKFFNEAQEYTGNLKRAYYLRYALASGTEAEKAKAAEEIALLRSVAAARGKSPDQWDQYGFVSLDEGFDGRTNTERAKQFLNYKMIEKKAAEGDGVARQQFDLLEQARQAVIAARSGDEERHSRPNIPVLVDALRPVSSGLRDIFANTIFGRFINEAGMSQRTNKGGEDAEFESVLGLDQVRLPQNELSRRIAENPQEAIDLYNATNTIVQRFYQGNVSSIGLKTRSDNVNYTRIKRIREKITQLSTQLEKTTDPTKREKLRTQIQRQERLLVRAESRLDRLLRTVLERETPANSVASSASDVLANQTFIGSIEQLNRQALLYDEENAELYPTRTRDLSAESAAQLAKTVASVAAGDLVEPVTINSELSPESAQLVQAQLDQMIASAETRQITVSPLSNSARNRHLEVVRSLRAKQQSLEAEGGQLTLSEKQKLNTSLGKLRQDAIARMRQKMPDDFADVVGLPQLSDLAYQLSSSEKTQNRADMLIAAVEAMSPEERVKASGIDFTDPYSRRKLAEQSGVWDQVLQLIPLGDADIAEAIRYMRPVSIADEATYTRGKHQRSAQRSVGQASADRAGIAATRKAKAAVAMQASDQGPMFFDLETNIPELDALNSFLARKAASNQTILDPTTGKQRKATTLQEYIARKRRQDANYDPLRDPRLAGIIPAYEGKPEDRSIIQAAVAGKEGDPEVFYGLPMGKGKSIREAIDAGKSIDEIRQFFPASVSADVISSLVTHARTYGTDTLLSQSQIRQRVRDRLNAGNRVVGHNINQFDIPTLGGGVIPETYDTLEEARRMGPRPSFTLGNLYQDAFGRPIQNAHTAGADVVANRELYEMFMSPTQREEFKRKSYDPLNLMPSMLSEVNDEARMRRARALLRYARPLSILQQFKKNPTGADAANVFKILGIDPSSVDLKDPTAVQALISGRIDPILAQHADVDYGAYAGYAVNVGNLRNRGDFGSGVSYARLGQDLQTMSFADFMERHARDKRPSIRNAAPDAGTVDLGVSGAVTTASTGGRRAAAPAVYGGAGAGGSGVGGGGGLGGGTVFGGGGMGGGPVGPVIIHTDSTTVHSATTHMGTTGGAVRLAAPDTDPTPDTSDLFAGAGGGATRSAEGREALEADASSGGMTTIGSANIGNFTSPGATVSINGSNVTINANFSAAAAGALKKSLVYVGAGGTTVSGTAMTPGVGGTGYQRRSVVSDMLFSQMDILRSETQRRLRATTDPMEQAQIQQEARQRYATLQSQALSLQTAHDAFGTEILNRNRANFNENPLYGLSSMSSQVLFEQLLRPQRREAIIADPTLSATEKEAQLAALDESDQQLTAFAAMIQRVTQDLYKFDSALQVPYQRSNQTASAAQGTSGSSSVPSVRTRRYGTMTETELAAKTGLEMARNQYEAFQGALTPTSGSESSRYAAMQDITARTRLFAASLLENDIEQPDLTGISFATPEQGVAAQEAASRLQEAIDNLSIDVNEKPIEELTSDLMRVSDASDALRSALANASDSAAGSGDTERIKGQLDELNKGIAIAGSQAKTTSRVIDTESNKNYRTLEENLQAIVSQQGLLRRFTGGMQREARTALREHLTGVFGDDEAGRRAVDAVVNPAGQVTAYRNGRRRNIVGASRSDLAELQDEVFRVSGRRISVDELERLQKTMARVQQTRNQSPFNDTFFYAMSRVRDIQTLGQTVMGALNLPQTIASTIGQIGDPQLRTERIMTTARALSLSPETYTKALAAATRQQSMFGGTLARNLEDMTSFIPISNTYGVDVGKSVQVARKLAAFDPAQGMQGASIALKEFLSGNVSSLSRRFEINRSELSKINTGDANEMLDSLDTLLAKMGVTDKLIDDQANSLATKYDRMTGRLETLQVQFSAFAVGAMTPILEPLLGDRSFLARQSLDLNLQKVVNERLKSYGDAVLSDPDTGLKTVDVFSTDFEKQLDPILAKANEATSIAALDFTATTGNISNVQLYRRLGNMSADERRRIQQRAQSSVLMGMNQDQAILQAMRDVGGDYFSGEEYQAQRRPLGFYGPALDITQRRELENRVLNSNRRQMAFPGVIERLKDADTAEVRLSNGRLEVVRLANIDAPEKNTPEGKESIQAVEGFFAGQAEGSQVIVYTEGRRDEHRRLIGSIESGGRDLGATLVSTGNAAVFNYQNATNPALLQDLSALERNAANIGLGPINREAARLGLGANTEISQQARDQYFRNTYLSTAALAAVAGGGAGYTLGGLATLFGGGIGAASGAATAGATVAGTAAAPALPFILGGAALLGGGYLGYATYQDSRDTSSAKSRELQRLQSEIDQQAAAEKLAARFYPEAAQQERGRLAFNDTLRAGSTLFAGSFGLLPRAAVEAYSYFEMGKQDQETARDEFVTQYLESSKQLAKHYNGLAENEKEVYSLIINDPITGQKSTVFDVLTQFNAFNERQATDPVASKLLADNRDRYTDLQSRVLDTQSASKLLAIAQEYGIVSTFRPQYAGGGAPRDSRYMQPVSRVISQEEYFNLSASERKLVNQQLDEQINTASWKRFAKEYADQSMEKQYQMTQQRFTQFVDLNALNAFAGFGAFREMTNPLVNIQRSGFGRAEESIVDTALRNMSRTDFVEGVKFDKSGQEELRNAQEAAVKQLTSQTTAYKEQEALTRPFNQMVKSTYNNFIQTLSKSGALYDDLVSYLSQGNPRGFLDLSQQMTGFNVQAIMQNRITSQNQGVMGITGPTTFGASGPGAVGPSFNFGYTQGPRGTMQYVRDFMNAPELPLFNPATILSTIMQGVQANTEIVQRNIQFGRQMRDSEINNKRSLEDINRDGMRNLEDIHRNYTRNMLQLTQQAEASKRFDTASFYTNAIAANIPENERNRITAAREQGRQKASHFEEADVAGYLKSPDGMQDTELQAAYAEYEAVPWTDYNAKQAAWRKVMDLVGARRTAAKNRMDSATTTEEKSAATAQYELLTSNPERGISYRKHVDDWANSELDKAQRRQQLTIQRTDLEREGTRLQERQPALQRQLAEAKTPEEMKAAQDAIEDNQLAIERNSEALAQNAREFSSLTATTTLWADHWAEAEKNILNNSASTLSGLINNLKDFDLKYAQSLADAYTGFSRAKEDMVRQFTDAATEISAAVPAEFAKALSAITEYQRMTLKAEALYNAGDVVGARRTMSDADKNLVRTLYPNGGPQYEEMMTNLQNSRNSMTASGFKKEDLTMGPSGLGAYGEMRGGKAYLRVIVEARDKLPPIDTPRETTPEGGPPGYFRDYIPDDTIEP